MEIFKTRLADRKQLTADVWEFKFEIGLEQELNFQAGQGLTLLLEDRQRFYPLSSPDFSKNSLVFLTKLPPEDQVSNYLRMLEIDDRIFFRGPTGDFILKQTQIPKFFLATGIGIGPIRSQIVSLLQGKKDTQTKLFLFWGVRRDEAAYFFEEFKTLKQDFPNFNFLICLDKEEDFLGLDVEYFRRGKVNEVFLSYMRESKVAKSELGSFEYYVCGEKQPIESIKSFLIEQGINENNILSQEV